MVARSTLEVDQLIMTWTNNIYYCLELLLAARYCVRECNIFMCPAAAAVFFSCSVPKSFWGAMLTMDFGVLLLPPKIIFWIFWLSNSLCVRDYLHPSIVFKHHRDNSAEWVRECALKIYFFHQRVKNVPLFHRHHMKSVTSLSSGTSFVRFLWKYIFCAVWVDNIETAETNLV